MGHIGETLKKARELREIDLREISDATKINIRYLEAIETNHFEVLPGGVFNKGFIRAYANYIGLDGQSMVDDYLHGLEAGSERSSGSENAPPGLHRPNANPPRRAAPAEPAASGNPAGHDRVPLHLTSLQEVQRDGEDTPRTVDGTRTLPRIAWVMVAAGILLCILAIWKYAAHDARPSFVADTTTRSRPPSAGPPSDSGPSKGSPDEEATLAGAVAPDAGQAPSSAGGATASPEPSEGTTSAEVSPPAPHRPQPDATAAEEKPAADRPEPGAPSPGDNPPDPLPEPRAPLEAEGAPDMTILITASRRTRVRVICDGRETIDREMGRGETVSLSCAHLIRLSAPDASSISLAINGSACRALGAPGSRLFGYVIRTDDYETLCPKGGESTNVTR